MSLMAFLQQHLGINQPQSLPTSSKLSPAVQAKNNAAPANTFNAQGQPTNIVIPNTDWGHIQPPMPKPIALRPMGQLSGNAARGPQLKVGPDIQGIQNPGLVPLQRQHMNPQMQQGHYNQQSLQIGPTSYNVQSLVNRNLGNY